MARILVVDDDDNLRTVLRTALENAGHEVTDANDGRAALRQLETVAVDCVITDMHMPEIDGLALTRAVRQRSDAPAVIAMSSKDIAGTLRMAELLGARVTLHKPFTVAQLLDAVENAVA